MSDRKRARIISTGSYMPEKVLSNKDLEKIVDTSDEWIISRTGMKERRIAAKEEYSSHMGIQAAKQALEKANMKPEDIDVILCATLTPDHMFPSTACLIQKELNCQNAFAMDLQAACTGYLYGLSLAKAYIESGLYKNVLLVASEKLSCITDYTDRNTCVLFGDGASACVVSDKGRGLHLRDIHLGCDGNQAHLLYLPAGGSKQPASEQTVAERLHYIRMDGKEVFKHAVRRMEAAARASLESAQIPQSTISWMVPHQANIRIIEAIAKRFEVSMEKVYLTIHKYGNTSASSVGIALDELLQEKDIQDGENLLLVAFGAGLTWGASTLTMGDDI